MALGGEKIQNFIFTLTPWLRGSKMSVDYGEWSIWSHCQTWFDWASDKLTHIWFTLFLKKLKMTRARFERAPTGFNRRRFCPLRQLDMLTINDWLLYKLLENLTYECSCKTIESLKLVKITTFDQNQFMTCYLILDLRPTYFSYFQK